MRNVIPVWASRGSFVSGSSFGFYFDETFNVFDTATDLVKDIDLGYLGMDLKIEKGGNNQKKFCLYGLSTLSKTAMLPLHRKKDCFNGCLEWSVLRVSAICWKEYLTRVSIPTTLRIREMA